jgi:hypothetical protein
MQALFVSFRMQIRGKLGPSMLAFMPTFSIPDSLLSYPTNARPCEKSTVLEKGQGDLPVPYTDSVSGVWV